MGFGSDLRQVRVQHGWRQQDLADALDGIARSTIANVEAEREPPTPRLWQQVTLHLPEAVESLRSAYEVARQEAEARAVAARSRRPSQAVPPPMLTPGKRTWLVRPFTIEALRLVYVFGASRAPEEIIEVRTVRATESGADGYELALWRTDVPQFQAETEVLWGGHLTTERETRGHRTAYIRRVSFGQTLRRGQAREFALRTWVQKDPNPPTMITTDFTLPARRVRIDLHFRGSEKPIDVWQFGPIRHERYAPKVSAPETALDITPEGSASAEFPEVSIGPTYGVSWRWQPPASVG